MASVRGVSFVGGLEEFAGGVGVWFIESVSAR